MAEIRLQFVAMPGIESRLIRWLSAGHPSHVDTIMPDGRLLGARADGVKLRPPEYGRFCWRQVARVPCSDDRSEAFCHFLRDQLGKPYDNLALLGFLFGRDWQHEGQWTCSELPARGLEVAGLVRQWPESVAKITPVMLMIGLAALPGCVFEKEICG